MRSGRRVQKRSAPQEPTTVAVPSAIGRFTGESGFLWALFVDAAKVNRWDVKLEPKAFRMIEARAAHPVVDVGGERGIVAGISTSGEALIWSHPDGFVMCDYFPADHIDTRKSSDIKRIAPHVLAAPAGKPRLLGEIRPTSGVLAMLLPHVKPNVTPTLLARAKAAKNVTMSDGLCLVPLAPGAYEVVHESLGEYRTDEGLFTGRLWVVRKGTFRKKATTRSKPVKARATKASGKPAPAKQATAPKTDPYEYRRTRMLPGGGTSVLFVREAKGGKEFVLVVSKGRTLSTESGNWGEEGTWSKKTLPSSSMRARTGAFSALEHQLRRKHYKRA